METKRVKIHLKDGSVIDGVERHWDCGIVDWADLRANVIDEDNISEVQDAG